MKAFFLFLAPAAILAVPQTYCPLWMHHSGIANDLGLLADAVSWVGGQAQGVCANYTAVYEANGVYDTRMRVYRSDATGDSVIVFRPTQQTPQGEAIHEDRQMVPCDFVPHCVGRVHERFQEAFHSLTMNLTTTLGPRVYLTGHSLGGALAIFMAITLWELHGIIPSMNLGFAGPFIGDEEFTIMHQYVLKYASRGTWWEAETVDKSNPHTFDGTTENYQVGDNGLFIDQDLVCGLPILPLATPQEAYGMHDLKQYRLYLTGTDC